MITWVTVWVLTVTTIERAYTGVTKSSYQLQYASQAICERQRQYHKDENTSTRCDFQQIPVVKK